MLLPKMDGISLVQNLRREGLKTPIIFLSAKGSVEDRVRGLQSGGDDYLTKPFSFAELLALSLTAECLTFTMPPRPMTQISGGHCEVVLHETIAHKIGT